MTGHSTAWYVYGITDATRAPACAGLRDQACALVAERSIAAIVSPISAIEMPATPENLWRHEAVIEQVMAQHTVLPARFGMIAASEQALVASLAADYDQFSAQLQRLRGCVELGLRVLWEAAPPPPAAPAISGRGYMLARMERERHGHEQQRAAQALADALHQPLAQLAEEADLRLLATAQMPLAASYLLPRARVDSFRDAVAQLAQDHPTLRLLCTGPWPPYSFVTTGALNG